MKTACRNCSAGIAAPDSYFPLPSRKPRVFTCHFYCRGHPVRRRWVGRPFMRGSSSAVTGSAMNGYKVIVEKVRCRVYTSEWVQNALRAKATRKPNSTLFQILNFCVKEPPSPIFSILTELLWRQAANGPRESCVKIYAPLIDGSYAQLPSAVPSRNRRGLCQCTLNFAPKRGAYQACVQCFSGIKDLLY